MPCPWHGPVTAVPGARYICSPDPPVPHIAQAPPDFCVPLGLTLIQFVTKSLGFLHLGISRLLFGFPVSCLSGNRALLYLSLLYLSGLQSTTHCSLGSSIHRTPPRPLPRTRKQSKQEGGLASWYFPDLILVQTAGGRLDISERSQMHLSHPCRPTVQDWGTKKVAVWLQTADRARILER